MYEGKSNGIELVLTHEGTRKRLAFNIDGEGKVELSQVYKDVQKRRVTVNGMEPHKLKSWVVAA